MDAQDPIISILLKEKIVSKDVAAQVVDRQRQTGQSMLALLKADNLLDEEQYSKAVAAVHKIEFINLAPDAVDPVAAHLVPYEMASRETLIPVNLRDDQLMVAMASPLNLAVRDQIEVKTGYKVVPVAATPSAIRHAIHSHFDVVSVTRQAIVSMRLKKDSEKLPDERESDDISPAVANDPITKLVSSIIRGAVDARASDIHIEPQTGDVRVRYRVDGLLRKALDVPASAQLEVVSHIKIMSDMDISERRLPQDGHMSIRHDEKEYDLRVSCLPAVGGEKIVIRILDKSANKWSLDTVVTSPADNKIFRELAANPYGMVLLTGPTGSGKTTTLYSLLQLINTPQRNIVTVEDPVEYRLEGITQVQVRPAAGLVFASALRSILRQDPNIILIGEIRDLETAEIAISAALTGHLVLSTLHTNDAAGAISRLVNLGIPPFLVGSALLGAVAQRLVRTCCPKCRRKGPATREEIEFMFGKGTRRKKVEVVHGSGCEHCYGTGYKGRKSIYEILVVSPTLRRMILEGRADDAIKRQAMEEGMRTLRASALEEVLAKATTVEEILRVVDVRSE